MNLAALKTGAAGGVVFSSTPEVLWGKSPPAGTAPAYIVDISGLSRVPRYRSNRKPYPSSPPSRRAFFAAARVAGVSFPILGDSSRATLVELADGNADSAALAAATCAAWVARSSGDCSSCTSACSSAASICAVMLSACASALWRFASVLMRFPPSTMARHYASICASHD